jgi:nitrile hydratase subunit beta
MPLVFAAGGGYGRTVGPAIARGDAAFARSRRAPDGSAGAQGLDLPEERSLAVNGPHDLGGRHGFGPVKPERSEPPWHYDWEARMHVMALACQVRGFFVLDEQRHSLERLPPAKYLHSSYYERWYDGVSGLLVSKGIIDREALDARTAAAIAGDARLAGGGDDDGDDLGDVLVDILYGGASALREAETEPRFAVGDRVVTKNLNASTHHRLPSYVKAKPGVIAAIPGAFTLNDSLAHGSGESPTHVYTVGFSAADLWGEAAEAPGDTVYVDLFETYLEPATERGEPS